MVDEREASVFVVLCELVNIVKVNCDCLVPAINNHEKVFVFSFHKLNLRQQRKQKVKRRRSSESVDKILTVQGWWRIFPSLTAAYLCIIPPAASFSMI